MSTRVSASFACGSIAVSATFTASFQQPRTSRGCVILKDVLDHSTGEIASQLELSVPAVKAALHRERAVLRGLVVAERSAPVAGVTTPALARYACLFNDHDWNGVRALLADGVKLDPVSRRKAAGRREVGTYFSNCESAGDWWLTPGWLDHLHQVRFCSLIICPSHRITDEQHPWFR